MENMSCSVIPGTDILHARMRAPHIGLSGESPATAGTPKAQAPPGNAQAHERQIAGALESGGRPWAATHRRGAAPQAPDLSGHGTEGGLGMPCPAVLHIW